MSVAFDLFNPVHLSGLAVLIAALLLGLVHGITPDEHTWPITFSYAVGGYSSRRGLQAGLTFSAAFTLQRAIASELAYLGLARIFMDDTLNYVVYLLAGTAMLSAALYMRRHGGSLHLHIPGLHRLSAMSGRGWLSGKHDDVGEQLLRDPRPWMPAVHGMIAGWGFGAFALTIYTVLAPAMPSAAWGWVPGAVFGVGTAIMQAILGASFGWLAARRGLPPQAVRRVALITAAQTLRWGGVAFLVGGVFGLTFPTLANASWATGLHIPNLDQVGLPLLLVVFAVLVVGVSTLIRETRAAIALLNDSSAAPVAPKSPTAAHSSCVPPARS